MKRLLAILIILSTILTVCGCSKPKKNTDKTDKDVTLTFDTVTLTFIYGDKDIRVTLEDDEAKKVIAILDGSSYDSVSSGVPSCGFDKNISLKVGDRVFAIACDTCNYLQDMGNLRYFSIPKEDMKYIHSLFEKQGGYFPCI